MIHFDVTKTAASRHRSGLMRVSERLRQELGDAATAVTWSGRAWRNSAGQAVQFRAGDWLLTPELFSETERPGLWEFLRKPGVRTAAIYHDAIPLKFPRITWPQSVARHPEYLKMLSRFDRVLTVSETSRAELMGFWEWQGAEVRATTAAIQLGADFNGAPRAKGPAIAARAEETPVWLSVGIIEPRKNQALLLDAAEALIREGRSFRLVVVGRINPHFGIATGVRLRRLSRRYPQIEYHETLDDTALAACWHGASAFLFPTLAEGCGLPLLESLWMGVPCLCSDLPVLRENGAAGGCEFIPVNDVTAWTDALRGLLAEPQTLIVRQAEARQRALPSWRETAAQVQALLR